jgi:NADH-quinone oxidoreductase E subunit
VTKKQLAPEIEGQIQKLWPRFPEEHVRQVLCLPVLRLAQKQFGVVDEEVLDLVADRLELPRSHVLGVATFYTMFNTEPVGRFHLQVCTNVGCQLEGGLELFEHCKKRLRVENKGTTTDGKITLTEVECLAGCGFGPVAQIAERGKPEIPLYFEQLDTKRIDEIIDALLEGRVPVDLGV